MLFACPLDKRQMDHNKQLAKSACWVNFQSGTSSRNSETDLGDTQLEAEVAFNIASARTFTK